MLSGGRFVVGRGAASVLLPVSDRGRTVYSRRRSPRLRPGADDGPRGRGYRAAVTPWGWIRRSDVRLAVFCGVIQIAATAGAAHHVSRTHSCWWASACHPATPLDAGAYALLALGPLALVLRRRYVREVLAFVFAVTVVYVARGYPLGPNFLSLGFAIVSAMFAGERVLAWAAVGAGWLVFLGLPWALGHSGGPKVLAALAIAAWLLVALAGAEGVRSRRERFAEAKRSRELQARRQGRRGAAAHRPGAPRRARAQHLADQRAVRRRPAPDGREAGAGADRADGDQRGERRRAARGQLGARRSARDRRGGAPGADGGPGPP